MVKLPKFVARALVRFVTRPRTSPPPRPTVLGIDLQGITQLDRFGFNMKEDCRQMVMPSARSPRTSSEGPLRGLNPAALVVPLVANVTNAGVGVASAAADGLEARAWKSIAEDADRARRLQARADVDALWSRGEIEIEPGS